jgi:hypothetical protein
MVQISSSSRLLSMTNSSAPSKQALLLQKTLMVALLKP